MLSCKNPAFVLLALLALSSGIPSPAIAQHFSVGMKAGAATLKTVSTSGLFVSQSHPLVWGPAIEAVLPHNFGIEVSALRRQITYRWQGPFLVGPLCTTPNCIGPKYEQLETHAHSWEVPLVLKKYIRASPEVRIFAEGGLAIRHTTSTTKAHGLLLEVPNGPPSPSGGPGNVTPFPVGTFSENMLTPELVRRWSDGLVIGGGLDIKMRFLRLQPELHYTRWSNATLQGLLQFPPIYNATGSLQSNRNTFDVFISVLASR